jgi:hypothetical protein
MPARRSSPKPPKAADAKGDLATLGFRVADSGPHTSKTLMLLELEHSLRRPVWLGKEYQLQRQSGGPTQRGHWRALSPLAGPVAAPLEWVEPVLE